MHHARSNSLFLTRAYEQLLHLLFALSPLVAIVYLQYLQSPGLRFENHVFHELATTLAIIESLFITYVTWRCYRDSGEQLLRWLTLGFLGFSLIYAPHGLFTGLAHQNPMLFLLYGPASRVVMNACLLAGLLHRDLPADPPERRGAAAFWGRWIAGLVGLDLLVAWLAYSPLAPLPWVRLSMEWSALGLALGGLIIMLRRRERLPLLLIYTLAMAFFAQASLAFILAGPWNHQWWLAHAISASGFLLLSYGVIRAFHTTRSFATVYSQEEIMQQLETANEELTRMATTDGLTGISNRRHFLERMDTELARSQRSATVFSLLAIDLDYFKQINDVHGHQAGDEVLRQTVHLIGATLRASDLLGRLGGEEFAVLLPETPSTVAAGIAERICREIAAGDISFAGQKLQVTVSIGVAEYPADGERADTVYAMADRRLYAAKHAGRNQVCWQ